MYDFFFVCVGRNATFEDGSVSILLAASKNQEDLAPGKKNGQLVSMTVSDGVFKKGLCPGASGMCTGELVKGGKREDGTPWVRARVSGKVTVTRKGNLAVGESAVVFEE